MAYLDRNAPNNRAAVLTAVALIHAAAGYAIVTGLAVDYYKEITTVFEARNIPADPLAPPPEPKPQPSAKPVEQRVVTAERPLELPTRNRTAVEQRQDILPPVPFPTGDADIFVPMPPPPAPVPTGTPRAAKPQGRPGNWVTTRLSRARLARRQPGHFALPAGDRQRRPGAVLHDHRVERVCRPRPHDLRAASHARPVRSRHRWRRQPHRRFLCRQHHLEDSRITIARMPLPGGGGVPLGRSER